MSRDPHEPLQPMDIADRWETLGAVDPEALAATRVQLHWAVQPIGSLAEALAKPQPDHAHLSMAWQPEAGRFVGTAVVGGHRAALRPRDLTLALLDADLATRDEIPLAGWAFDDVLAWLGAAIGTLTGSVPRRRLSRPSHDLPPHPVGEGEAFAPLDPAACEELERWYCNADLVTTAVRGTTRSASPVRCWPHHFDLATLIRLDADAGSDDSARSIGFGLSPGDEHFAEPYFYVTPWPAPDPHKLPSLDGGAIWYTRKWVGAVLPAGTLLTRHDGRDQCRAVLDFAMSAVVICRHLLAGGDGSQSRRK